MASADPFNSGTVREKTVAVGPFSSRARIAAIVAAVVIGGLGVRSALGFALVGIQPALAYQVDSGNAEAVAAYANLLVGAAEDEADVAVVRATARDALRKSPLAPFALRSYGLATAVAENEDIALPMLQVAGTLSMRDYLTHAWLFDKYYRDGNVERALSEGDIVLTQRQSSAEIVIPPLLTLLPDDRMTVPLATALARNPVWRGRMLGEMGIRDGDRDAKYRLLRAIQLRGAPATTAELTPYFNTFTATTPPTLLRQRWNLLVGRPAEDREPGLIDGEFDAPTLPPPFNWRLFPSEEIYAEILERGDGQGKALFASYNGRENARFANQLMLLPAGSYRLEGMILGEEGVRPDEFRWNFHCGTIGDNAPFATVTLQPSTEDWRPFAADINVPGGCDGVMMVLTAQTIGTPRASTLWIDSLRIVRQ